MHNSDLPAPLLSWNIAKEIHATVIALLLSWIRGRIQALRRGGELVRESGMDVSNWDPGTKYW